jgi:lipopolysaccharide/colanic/teichoic acid biosynthesis glycosyltransferase
VAPARSTEDNDRVLELSCRALDIVGAAVMLVALAPLLGLIALLVKLDSPGPVLFRQRRLGRDAKPFTVNKFRTMHHGVAHDRHREFVLGLINGEHSQQDGENLEHESPGPRYKMVGDRRMTRFGRVLRRSSLDELPQLWNVLRGDMSLVGPRPPIPYEVEHYPPHWFARFAVKPGITGLWQVSGRSEVTLEEMVRLDVEYARRRSLWFNIVILVRTVPAVLSGRGAW